MLELNETVPLPLFYLFYSKILLQTKHKRVKPAYVGEYKMLRLVSLWKMFYELSVILTDHFQNKYGLMS